MKYYLIEINEPTNRPGQWCHRKIFRSKAKADKYFNEVIKGAFEPLEMPITEWDDGGDNWKIIKTFSLDDGCSICMSEINNGEENNDKFW